MNTLPNAALRLASKGVVLSEAWVTRGIDARAYSHAVDGRTAPPAVASLDVNSTRYQSPNGQHSPQRLGLRLGNERTDTAIGDWAIRLVFGGTTVTA